MAVRIFKRIAKDPLPPPPPPKAKSELGVEWPSREAIGKTTATEAYYAGETFGEAILAAKKLGVSVKDLLSGAAKTNVAIATSGTMSPAQVAAAAINLKRDTAASGGLTDVVTTLFKKSDTGIGHKQWSIYVRNGDSVVIEWGHCDKTKQEKVYPFVNRPQTMENWMREAIREKMKKGYSRTK